MSDDKFAFCPVSSILRCIGMSLGCNISVPVFGGFASLVVTRLIGVTGRKLASSFYPIATSDQRVCPRRAPSRGAAIGLVRSVRLATLRRLRAAIRPKVDPKAPMPD